MTQDQNDDKGQLYRLRHSLAHIMAHAVCQLRPGTRLGFGPAIEDGFYYDFILSSPLTEKDFPIIEAKMREFITQGHPFIQKILPAAEALKQLDDMQEPYKKEYAQELLKTKSLTELSFFQTGSFIDMCEGPHINNTQQIPTDCFRLKSIAGAYWRGNSQNMMMTRIYAWAFASAEKLTKYLEMHLEAQKRDHKKLGKELEIFAIHDAIGKGLPLWLPNGTILREECEKLMKELEFQAGYQRVCTPHIAKSSLYHQTGHLPYYQTSMFPAMQLLEDQNLNIHESYHLRPMNCPHHHIIYATHPKSYRDLPFRLAEFGQVYRFEDSGALSGILRARGFCMNDAHIYCTKEQIKAELVAVFEMHKQAYHTLGIEDYYYRLSTADFSTQKAQDKFVHDPDNWEWSEKLLELVLQEQNLPYQIGKGEAAFYGPKVDIQLKTVTGREETLSTVQIDFVMAKRLNLFYTDMQDQQQHPLIIHRAPLSTHERMIAFLIEKTGGAFPTWLAPVQVQVIAISEKFIPYAQTVVQRLRQQFIRAHLNTATETLNKKIRHATLQKIPNILIIGEKEQTQNAVTWKRYRHEQQLLLSVPELEEKLLKMIQTRTDTLL